MAALAMAQPAVEDYRKVALVEPLGAALLQPVFGLKAIEFVRDT